MLRGVAMKKTKKDLFGIEKKQMWNGTRFVKIYFSNSPIRDSINISYFPIEKRMCLNTHIGGLVWESVLSDEDPKPLVLGKFLLTGLSKVQKKGTKPEKTKNPNIFKLGGDGDCVPEFLILSRSLEKTKNIDIRSKTFFYTKIIKTGVIWTSALKFKNLTFRTKEVRPTKAWVESDILGFLRLLNLKE